MRPKKVKFENATPLSSSSVMLVFVVPVSVFYYESTGDEVYWMCIGGWGKKYIQTGRK